MDVYDVVFEGKLLPGRNINSVKKDFSRLFKIASRDKVDKLFCGHPVVLKKSLALEQAEVYERALLKIGAYCRHQQVEVEKPLEMVDYQAATPEVSAESEPSVEEVTGNADAAGEEEQDFAIEFEYTAKDSLATGEAAAPQTAVARAEEQPVAEAAVETGEDGSNSIDFEYAEMAAAGDAVVEGETDSKVVEAGLTKTATLAGLSLVPIEEASPADEDDVADKGSAGLQQ